LNVIPTGDHLTGVFAILRRGAHLCLNRPRLRRLDCLCRGRGRGGGNFVPSRRWESSDEMGAQGEPQCVGPYPARSISSLLSPIRPKPTCRAAVPVVARAGRGAYDRASVNHSFNLSFTVRGGTTRMRHRTMAEFASAQSGIHATPQMSSRWIAGPSHQSWRSQKRMEPWERVLPRGSPFFWVIE
jgi:hypothetical protein